MDPVFFLPLSSSRLAWPALGTCCSAFSGPPRSPEPSCWSAQRAVPFGPECLMLEAAPLLCSPCLGLALQVSPAFYTWRSLSLSVSLLWVLGNHLLPGPGSSLLLAPVVTSTRHGPHPVQEGRRVCTRDWRTLPPMRCFCSARGAQGTLPACLATFPPLLLLLSCLFQVALGQAVFTFWMFS